HQHNTYWTQSQARVTNALERIRPLSPSYTRGGSRMRESRTYGSVRGACDETHVPTATPPRVYCADRRRGGSVALCGAISVNWLTHAACYFLSRGRPDLQHGGVQVILQACRNMLSPSWARCSFRRSPGRLPRSRLASVALRVSSGSRRRSWPSSSRRSKA